ncbi:hypothetical protein J5X84_11005 [Streptosporangiaceae bacterium NEAU-GS5]|nr:hypothetical protein [Streptosporangiaceae bacterium NEAU-GS5]
MRWLTALILAVAGVLAVPATANAQADRPHPHRKPWPITITLRTVPALPHVRFSFDGHMLTTDKHGRVSYTRQHNFGKHTLVLLDESIESPQRHFRFARWAGQRDPDQAFRPSVTGLPMRANYTITAAFTVQYPVTASFVDQFGAALDLKKISSVKVKGDDGTVWDMPTTGAMWLKGMTSIYRKSALDVVPVAYSLQSITMNGTNIVDAGVQRFLPSNGPDVTFTAAFHDLTIKAHDALYGTPVGDTAEVTHPDGKVERVRFGPGQVVTLNGLPRGEYKVNVRGAGGIVLAEQFRLSKGKTLDVTVVSRADLATLGLAGLAVAVSLLVIGRTRWPRRFVRLVRGLRRTSREMS